ncbi:PAS domain S-box protein [Thiohalorhabdus sp.]
MAKLRLGPYERPGPFGLRDILRKYGHWVALGLLGVLVLAGVSLLLAGLNRRLKASRAALNEARNRLEERVAERTAELAASEHKYRGIINGAREGFWLVAPDLTILEANQALGRILGYTPEEIAGRTPIDFVAPDPRRILEVELGRIAESETRSYEVTLLAKSGSRVPVLVQATTLWDQAGSVRFAGGVLTDLTAFKEVEASLRRNNRVLRALSRSNRALLYAEDEQELLDEVCRIAVEEGGYPLAWIGFCERDRHDLRGGVAMAGERPNAMAQLGSECQDDMAERYPSLQAIAMGRPVILQDLGHHTEAHPPGPGRPPITDWPLWPRCPSATKASRGPW